MTLSLLRYFYVGCQSETVNLVMYLEKNFLNTYAYVFS